MNNQELDREIKATALRPLADKFQELARQIDSGKYDLPKSLADAEKITENYISQAYERIEKLIKQDQAIREIDIRIDELEKFNRYEYSQGKHKYFYDSDKNIAFTINDRIEELQAQKTKLIKGIEQ